MNHWTVNSGTEYFLKDSILRLDANSPSACSKVNIIQQSCPSMHDIKFAV